MGKTTTETRTTNKQSEMTVMVLQLKGSDDMIREGLKALDNVVAKMGQRTVVLPAPKNASGDQLSEPNADVIDAIATEVDEFEASDEQVATERKPRKKRGHAVPNVVPIDLEAGEIKFKDFVISKGSPDTTYDRYLVTAGWLREQGTTEIGVEHVFTVFEIMGWDGPKSNWYQPFYDIAKKHHWFDAGEKTGSYKLNTIGLSDLKKMGRTEQS